MKMNTALIVFVLLAVAFGLFYLSKNSGSASDMEIDTLKNMMKENPGVVIDVRTPDEFASGHLKKADHNFNVMSGELEQKLDSLDRSKTYYLYCRSGNRSGKAAQIMKRNGFEKVYNIGGFRELVNAGFESE